MPKIKIILNVLKYILFNYFKHISKFFLSFGSDNIVSDLFNLKIVIVKIFVDKYVTENINYFV